MSGTSSVGQASVYEAGDQRNSKQSETNTADRYEEGTANAHKSNDSSMTAPLVSAINPEESEGTLVDQLFK
jgi:hypothetical protein